MKPELLKMARWSFKKISGLLTLRPSCTHVCICNLSINGPSRALGWGLLDCIIDINHVMQDTLFQAHGYLHVNINFYVTSYINKYKSCKAVDKFSYLGVLILMIRQEQ